MLDDLIDFSQAQFDGNGILVVNDKAKVKHLDETTVSEEDFKKLRDKVDDINRNKLADHWNAISKTGTFTDQTVFLEIGCWPGYLGEYLMARFDIFFIGVDFNYHRLLTLKKTFEQKGYKKYLLVCSDIYTMPVKSGSVDYVYGGGVIEHLTDTPRILAELYRVMKAGGVAYNTVPAFSLWWLTRFYNTVPDVPILKPLFKFVLLKVFRGAALARHHGYQGAFTRGGLKRMHMAIGFKEIVTGPFAFHPSDGKLKSNFLRNFAYMLRQHAWTAAIYFVHAKK